MSLYRAEGIVLRTRALGEADRIATIYTREAGKVRAVARGARRPRCRLSGSTEPFTHAEFLLFRGTGLDNISQVEIRESFQAIRGNLGLMARASYMAELLDRTTEEGEPAPEIFQLLLKCLRMLAQQDGPGAVDPDTVLYAYEARLLRYLGYAPMLDRCMGCGGPMGARRLVFYPSLGGVLCEGCRGNREQLDTAGVEISRRSVEFLRWLLSGDLERLGYLRIPPSSKNEIREVLHAHEDFRLDSPLKSRGFLDRITEEFDGGDVKDG
ncbi:MAG TPA: DNA repair protein RecO [Firmicutes bacterium]|nr:DNA repair protein RecO [Bacillota bacterium]